MATMAWILLACWAAGAVEGSPVRVAVAPFSDEPAELPLASALAGRLARRPIERLIAPDAPVARADFDPRAEEIRRWAHTMAVDAIVVGRLVKADEDPAGQAYRAEAVVRSGHSGAELARHRVPIERPGDLGASAERLAAAILMDLGFVEPEPIAPPPAAIQPAPGDAAAEGAGSEGAGSEGDLETGLGLSGFQSDVPIEIKADEAEIVDRGDRRRLVFRDDVWVRQGNVTLRSQWLEAHYRKGESKPTRLVARGDVRVDQGDRQAQCDEAIYLEAEQRLSCRGHAELVQGCDVVRGDRIEFDLARDRATVEGAASIVIRSQADSEGEGSDPTCRVAGDAS